MVFYLTNSDLVFTESPEFKIIIYKKMFPSQKRTPF